MRKYENKKTKKKLGIIKSLEIIVLIILIISFAVLAYCVYVSFKFDKSTENYSYKATELSTQVGANNALKENTDISNTIEKVNSAVVGVAKLRNIGSTIFLSDGVESLGLGTGFIVSDDGYILTNEHVSGSKYSSCYVTLEDEKTYTGSVVWSDNAIDISIVKISANNLHFLELGDSNNLKIAQSVYAIGNPIGSEFQRTVTAGIISGLNRTIKLEENNNTSYMEDLIQTDATINPGNSGGPLINIDGEVIGINTVKITSAEGIGFASPINIVKPILNKLINGEDFNQATLGVFAYDKNIIPYINQDLGISQNFDSGIYVAKVIKNSPAYKEGIKEGDIILQIDDVKLEKMAELREYIYSKKPGDEVRIIYLKNNKKTETKLKLAKK